MVGKDPLEEVRESATKRQGHQQPKTPPQQPLALNPYHDCPGKIGQPDGPIGRQGEIAHGSEIVKVRVILQRHFQLRPALLQLGVLHLQFDLVHLQLMQQLLGIGGQVHGGIPELLVSPMLP